MNDLLRVTLLGLFFGTFGTNLGGIIGVVLRKPSQKFLSFILSFASGLMTSIVSFDLIPEALNISKVTSVILGILLGIICMLICNQIVDKKFNNSKYMHMDTSKGNLLKAGIIIWNRKESRRDNA